MQDQKIVEKFFEYLVFNDQAQCYYTLFGSKPISVCCLLKSMPSKYMFKLAPLSLFPPMHPISWMRRSWEVWKKYEKDFAMHDYMLFSEEREHCIELYLVNRAATIAAIQKNLGYFQKRLSCSDTPEEMFSRIIYSKDVCGKGLNRSHALFGILLGYGTENAIGFENYHLHNAPLKPGNIGHLLKGPESMSLPFFVSFSEQESRTMYDMYRESRKTLSATTKETIIEAALNKLKR